MTATPPSSGPSPSGPSRGKAKFVYLLAAVVIGLAAWSGAWAYGRSTLASRIDLQSRQLAGGGLDISCADLSIAGFPFRYEVSCQDFQSLNRSGIESAISTLEAVALVYNPWHIIFEAEAPAGLSLQRIGATGQLTWNTARASVKYSRDAVGDVDVVITQPELSYQASAERGIAISDRAEFHLRRAPDQDQTIEGFVLLDGLQLGFSPAGELPFDARLHMRIEDGEALLSGIDLPRLVQSRGGELPVNLVLADIATDSSRFGVRGDLVVHGNGTLSGVLSLTLSGKEAALDQVAEWLPEQEGGFAIVDSLLRSLEPTATDHNGDPAIQLPLMIDQGVMRIGFVTLGRIPPLFMAGS